ncbi:MAG: putative ABC transport system permease protein [Nitriliruptoraceae bacterium]|jgi:putative ABC transport system permease protein
MLRLALKSVLGNKVRLALTTLAVVLGVSFVSGTFILTDSIDQAFGGLFEEVNAGVDVYVNPATEFNLGGGGPPGLDTSGGATLDEALLGQVQAVAGVEEAVGLVEGLASIVGKDGARIGGQGPPTLGFSWAGENGPITLREGVGPTGPGDVVIDIASFTDGGFAIGDPVTIVGLFGSEEFTIVGASGFGQEDSLLGATTASFTLARAQQLFALEGKLSQIAIAAADGVDTIALKQAVFAAVGSDTVEVVSVDEQVAQQTAELSEGLAFLDYILLSFAGISLFVGAFLIVNTFSITVAQRMREFALLRAVGASARQLRAMVIGEAAIIGLIAGTIGVAGGIALSEALRAVFGVIGLDFPDGGLVLAPRTFIASYSLSIIVTVFAALLPARRAARVAPVEAMRGTGGGDTETIGTARTVIGALLAVVGVLALLAGLNLDVAQPVAFVGGGVGGLFIGVAMLAPWLAKPVAGGLGAMFGSSVVANLARRNAARNPTRTSTTASALMIGVALVSFISIVAASVTASVNVLFEEQFQADLVVGSEGGFGSLPRSLAAEVAAVDGVQSVSPSRLTQAQRVDGTATFVNGYDAATLTDHLNVGADEATMTALQTDGTIMLSEEALANEGLAAGDTITLSFPALSDVELIIVGSFENREVVDSPYIIDLTTYERVVGGGSDSSFSVVYVDGADSKTVQAAIEDVTAAYPGTEVQTLNDLLEQVQAGVNGLLNILIGLLLLALIIAVIGIINTLALSVLERTREIGLLRSVGMTRRQVRQTVRREAVLVALFGAILGVAIGSFFGWAMVTALADDGIEVLVFPGLRLVAYVCISAFAGVVAAAVPARRAARLDVLRAVTTE